MNPILRLRRAFRSIGADSDQADELASAIDDHYLTRQEFEDHMGRMMAENRNQILLGVLLIVSIGVAVILAVLA